MAFEKGTIEEGGFSAKWIVRNLQETVYNLSGAEQTSAGYAVRAASDGLNAILHMEETRFDVVLTDVSMPQRNGLELLTKIRERWPESRVVVHSALLTGSVARLAQVEGAYACLSKSYDTAQLLKTIASASLAV